jgi:hypothetical protein
MDSSVSPEDEIWFLRVCHHISTGLYTRSTVYVGVAEEVKTVRVPACCCQNTSNASRVWLGSFRVCSVLFRLGPKWFPLVPIIEGIWGDRLFKRDEEIKDDVRQWLNGLAADVYDEDIQTLITGYEKNQNIRDDYVEKCLRVGNYGTLNLFLFCVLFMVKKSLPSLWPSNI